MSNLFVSKSERIWDKKREQKQYKIKVKYAGDKDFESILYSSLVGFSKDYPLDSFNKKNLF